MSDMNAEGMKAAKAAFGVLKIDCNSPEEWLQIPDAALEAAIRAYLATLPPASEGRDVETDAMRKFVADARVWLDSRLENAKPEWMVVQLPAVEAALSVLSQETLKAQARIAEEAVTDAVREHYRSEASK